MKSISKIALVAFAAASFVLTSCGNGAETKSEAKTEAKSDSTDRPLAAGEKITYQCPMHPEQTSPTPAKCPICGMDMEKKIVKDSVK